MPDPVIVITIATTSLVALAMLSFAGLKGFTGWLALKHAQLASARQSADGAAPVASRIDIADLKERIRKLEAIAAGVDL